MIHACKRSPRRGAAAQAIPAVIFRRHLHTVEEARQ